jgi:hypothetical protein
LRFIVAITFGPEASGSMWASALFEDVKMKQNEKEKDTIFKELLFFLDR